MIYYFLGDWIPTQRKMREIDKYREELSLSLYVFAHLVSDLFLRTFPCSLGSDALCKHLLPLYLKSLLKK